MKVATQVTRIKMAISKGLATQHPMKLVGMLALGALVLAGTAVHFAPASDDELGDRPSVDKVEALRIQEVQREPDRQEDLQGMVRYWNQLKQNAATETTVESNDRGTGLGDESSLWMQPWTKPQVPGVVVGRGAQVQPWNEAGTNVQARHTAQHELIEVGFATIKDEDFQASVAEADDGGHGQLLLQAGFTEQQIRNAQERQREAYEEASANRFFQQLVSINAMSELRRQGFADFQGNVNVAAADDAGYGDLLLHAGFTGLQIQDAQRRQRQAYEEADADTWFRLLAEIQKQEKVAR